MIVTDRFVFIHLHKTGGQTVNRLITGCIPNHKLIGYHYPASEVPAEDVQLPIVGFVRNPWDWYVSWYAFNRRPAAMSPLFHVVSAGGTANFATTVRNLVELGSGSEKSAAHREQLSGILPESLGRGRGAGLTRSCMDSLVDSGQGYLSWLYGRMLDGAHPGGRQIGRFEDLRSELSRILADLKVPEADAMDALFDSGRRENVSQRSHYSHYYDDELRNLVASQDAKLIEEYRYEFEPVKPGGASYEYSAAWTRDHRPAFRKLLDRDESFLKLNDSLDVEPLRRKVELISPETWATSDRNRMFKVHSHTQSVALVHFEDYRHERPEYQEAWEEFRDELSPIIDYIADYYDDNGFVVRALLAKLSANGEIPLHTDAGYSLMNTHRIHLPVVTSDEVTFSVGGKTAQLRAGELWEINNATAHGVRNTGADDRVHLIIDWMPNRYGEPVPTVLRPDDATDTDDGAANEQMLASLVQQARQLQNSGQPDRAEALYRQVLHFDPTHVVAGNLLGLLCLRSRRFQEAVQYIERAMSMAPDDAQAHANLGLALKECGRLGEAVEHFRASLELAPGNLRVLNNLGGLLVLLGSAEEAIPCFREALRLKPGQAEIHFNLGSALLQAGRYDEALQVLEQCVALRPDFAEAQNRLQRARTMLGMTRN